MDRALTLRETYLLSDILETIRHSGLTSNLRFDASETGRKLNDPAVGSGLGALCEALGMRVIPTPDIVLDEPRFSGISFLPGGKDTDLKWRDIRNTRAVEYLQLLLRDCKVLSLSGWSRRGNASDLWDGLRLDVVRHLGRRDLKFIFHLGLPGKRSVYEVDEILDIVSDFSIYGKVTLLLDGKEAEQLWRILHGYELLSGSVIPELSDICQEIRDTLQVDFVVILCHDRMVAHARDGKLAFAYKVAGIENQLRFP